MSVDKIRFIDKFEKWLNSNLLFKSPSDDTFENKIDLLERLIELARFSKNYTNNNIRLEQLRLFDLDFIENGKMMVLPGKNHDFLFLSVDPKKPEELQILLLIFLLVYDKSKIGVYPLIEKFIQEILSYLNPLDFEKTATGATRCFTNTRFAANSLRYYGLLKCTREDKYKTWRLSFLGLLVASFLYDSYWRSKVVVQMHNYKKGPQGLSKVILKVFDIICNQRALESALRIIDKRQSVKFQYSNKEFEAILSHVRKYSDSIFSLTEKQKDKSGKAMKIIEEIEKIPFVSKFLNEFKSSYEAQDFSRVIWKYIRRRSEPRPGEER
jgi:hypothetical protein